MFINSKVDLELYKVFYTAALLGSMTKTAEKLYIGQPAVSKAIKAIEEKLEATLFVRGSHGLALTNEGMVLFEHISQAMEQIQLAEDSIFSMKNQSAKTIKIEICAMQFKLLILPHLKTFFECYNKNVFDISPTNDTYTSLRLLEEGKIDCCIVTKPMDIDKFKFIKLFTFHDYLMGSPEYIDDIAASGRDLPKNATLISVMNKSIMSHYEQMRLKNISFTNKMKVTSMDHTIALAKLGYGVGIIAEELVLNELLSEQLIKVDIPYPRHKRDVGFLFNKNTKANETLGKFIDYFSNLYIREKDDCVQKPLLKLP